MSCTCTSNIREFEWQIFWNRDGGLQEHWVIVHIFNMYIYTHIFCRVVCAQAEIQCEVRSDNLITLTSYLEPMVFLTFFWIIETG